MSSGSRSDSDSTVSDIEELLYIEARCRELRKEKDSLQESQSQSYDLIKGLNLHVKRLVDAHSEDNKQIHELERELSNCHQEIDYLRDQLNASNAEVDRLKHHIDHLETTLANTVSLQDEVIYLREEHKRSNSERVFLTHQIETKEAELLDSNLQIERLEESISSVALEYQCEIESMRLEMMAMEQECLQDKARMNEFVHELEDRVLNAQKSIEALETENLELKNALDASERNAKSFFQWLENKEFSQSDLNSELSEGNEMGNGYIFKAISQKIQEYENIVKRLKEELREEKVKAKEEAEELAQEMAELRYKMTGMLEEECKRRSCIEQASLQRISELEEQLQLERRKSVPPIRHH